MGLLRQFEARLKEALETALGTRFEQQADKLRADFKDIKWDVEVVLRDRNRFAHAAWQGEDRIYQVDVNPDGTIEELSFQVTREELESATARIERVGGRVTEFVASATGDFLTRLRASSTP